MGDKQSRIQIGLIFRFGFFNSVAEIVPFVDGNSISKESHLIIARG